MQAEIFTQLLRGRIRRGNRAVRVTIAITPKKRLMVLHAAKKIVACIQQLPSPYGIALIADVLTGAKSSRVRNYHLDKLPAYATMKESSTSQLRTWIGELIRQGYLARTGDKYPVIRLTNKSHDAGQGNTFTQTLSS